MMERRHVLGFSLVYLLLFVVSEVKGTLTPNGPLFLDCGSQQTFTCSVNGTAAGWTITGLNGITVMESSGLSADNNNARIINTDTGDPLTSTITITGFNASDNGVVQCIELITTAVQGMTAVSVGPPSCPAITISPRITDFTAVNVTWPPPPNSPPVTSTAVTYCPTSSPNCGNSVTCTSPCTISGLNPCVNYSVTVTPSNNCGSATGCTMNMVDSLSKGTPGCGKVGDLQTSTGEFCPTISWDPDGSLATMLMISYSSTGGDRSIMCTTPLQNCTIDNVQLGTSISISPGNNCGFTAGCPGHSVGIKSSGMKDVGRPNSTCVLIQQPGGCGRECAVGVGIGASLLVVIVIAIIVMIVVVCYCYPRARSVCCCCVSGGSKRPTSTEPMKPRPAEEYADPQKVRENKESGKQGGITYAALEFSEQAGSTGGQNVRSKEQPVQYMAVEHA